jgi:two-component system sensor histidine kinase HydH
VRDIITAMTADGTARRARVRTAHRIALTIHVVAYVGVFLLLAVLFFPAAIIVALAWGIGLAIHVVVAVLALGLRERWIAEELAKELPVVRADERRSADAQHQQDVERLAASLAHDIRNPIAAAKSLVRQIHEDPSAATTTEYARVAEQELDRVEASIAHLLRFAREESVKLADVRLRDVVSSAIDVTRERTAGVRVDADVPDLSLRADADALRRVLANLLTNAADAVRDGSEERRVVHVEGGASLDGAAAWIRVEDRGPGIAPELRDRLFEPWVTGKDAGTGLGLGIARKLCAAHGGDLAVERTSSDGTAMLVTIPTGASA